MTLCFPAKRVLEEIGQGDVEALASGLERATLTPRDMIRLVFDRQGGVTST